MPPLTKLIAPIAVLAASAFSPDARADMYSFGCITGSNVQNCQTGALQLTVEVLAAANGQAQFIFRNSGPLAASITDIYFDDGTLLGIAGVTNGAGVDFSQGASPGNLPGGNSIYPQFAATAGFTADSNPPTQPNGVNPGERVTIFFALQSGGTFADVISELYSGELRIGIHAQGFSNGGSESFINAPSPVPLPAAAWLLLSGVGALGGLRRKGQI